MNKKSIAIYFGFGILITVLFGIVMAHELKHGDFPAHIAWAKEYSQNGYLYKIPHTLFAKLVVIVRALLPANVAVWVSPFAKQVFDLKSFELSTLIVTTLTYLALGLMILRRLIKNWELEGDRFMLFAGIAAFAVLFVGPIFLFTFPDRMFLGYVTGNRFDSPTYIVSKPFVMLMFFGVVDNFFSKWSWKQAFVIVFAVMCATLAKPSFTITIIPAIGLAILLNLKKFKQVNWGYFFIPMGLTSAIILISQFIINYSGDRGDRIIIAPFQSILFYVPNMFLVTLFIIMSLIFPLLVTLTNWQKVKKDIAFQLAWINFVVALAYAMIFAEEINLGVNNFWNGLMIGIFVLFFVTVSYWGKEIVAKLKLNERLSNGQIISSVMLGLHLLCGLIYYVATVMSTTVMVN